MQGLSKVRKIGNGKATFGFNAQILAEIDGLTTTQNNGDFYLAKGQLQFVDHSYNLHDFLPCFLGYSDTGWGLSDPCELNIHGMVLAAKILPDPPDGTGEYPAGLILGIYYVQVPLMHAGLPIGEIPFTPDTSIPIGFFLAKVQDRGEPGVADEGDWFKIWLFPSCDFDLATIPTEAELVSALQTTIEQVDLDADCYSNEGFLSGGNIQVKVVENGDGVAPGALTSNKVRGKKK